MALSTRAHLSFVRLLRPYLKLAHSHYPLTHFTARLAMMNMEEAHFTLFPSPSASALAKLEGVLIGDQFHLLLALAMMLILETSHLRLFFATSTLNTLESVIFHRPSLC